MTRYGYFISSEEYDPAEFFAGQVLPRARQN
jgi:hypothetical protein